MTEQFLVIIGNPAAGFDHYGPFATWKEANDWGEACDRCKEDWWISDLVRPT